MAIQESTPSSSVARRRGRKPGPKPRCVECGTVVSTSHTKHCHSCAQKTRRARESPDVIARQTFNCLACGKSFRSKSLRRKYCSVSCAGSALRNDVQQCEVCHREFWRKRHGGNKDSMRACSRVCGWALISLDAKSKRIQREQVRLAERAAKQQRVCNVCGIAFASVRPRPVCGDACAAALVARIRKQRVENERGVVLRGCAECGRSFVVPYGHGRAGRTLCSDSCRKRRTRAAGRRRGKSHSARARQRGQRFDPTIRRVDVFERDGWTCQLCRCSTPRRLLSDFRSLQAPTLDHIVALSQGGSHTLDNVQCACRGCNSRKGAKAIGQPRLFA